MKLNPDLTDHHGRIIFFAVYTLTIAFLGYEFGKVEMKRSMQRQWKFGSVKPAFGKLVEKK